VRVAQSIEYRQKEVKEALQKASWWLFANRNEDGGWVFRRDSRFVYAAAVMSSHPNGSNLFATWFRLLSLRLLATTVPDLAAIGRRWCLLRSPGHQLPCA
jgi:hypothetical protein